MSWTPPPNWPKSEAGWSPPPGWQPPAEWGPAPEGWNFYPADQPGAAGGPWYRRGWVLPVAAGLLGLMVGAAAAGGDDGAPGASDGAFTRLQENVRSAEEQNTALAAENSRLKGELIAERAAPAPPPSAPAPSPPAPPPPPPPPAAPPVAAGLKDGSFSATDPILKDTFGSFSGSARVTNTSGKNVQGAILTFTLFKSGAQVGVLQGSAQDVGAGETQTVQLISSDTFVKGVDKFEFQVDTEF